jgi:hypothetical protein
MVDIQRAQGRGICFSWPNLESSNLTPFQALELLVRLHGDGTSDHSVVTAEFEEICETLDFEASLNISWKALIYPGMIIYPSQYIGYNTH